MIWALKNNKRILAVPKEKALCPLCREEVISKCGVIKTWHWSHKADSDCDSWGEGETEWHLKWKSLFPKDMQEVVVGEHRADIKLPSGKVIELQNSPINFEEVYERELFYENMVWLLNGKELARGLELRKNINNSITFRWKHPSKTWWFANKPVYIDLGFGVFLLKKIYHNIPCGGWGILLTKKEFLNQL